MNMIRIEGHDLEMLKTMLSEDDRKVYLLRRHSRSTRAAGHMVSAPSRSRTDMPKMTKQAIAASVMAYATANYEKGWDFVVECYTEADIVAMMDERGFTTKKQVMDSFAIVRDWREDQIADAKNSAF
jgi:hypothetical protein